MGETNGIKSIQKFCVTIGDKEMEFNTEAEAAGALAEEGLIIKAEAFCDARGIEGKNKAARRNVVVDYLKYLIELDLAAETTEED